MLPHTKMDGQLTSAKLSSPYAADYIIEYGITPDGRRINTTKTEQVRLIGNMVCSEVAEALAGANYAEEGAEEIFSSAAGAAG